MNQSIVRVVEELKREGKLGHHLQSLKLDERQFMERLEEEFDEIYNPKLKQAMISKGLMAGYERAMAKGDEETAFNIMDSADSNDKLYTEALEELKKKVGLTVKKKGWFS